MRVLMIAVLVDGTEYGAELKTRVSELWVRTVFNCRDVSYVRGEGFGVTAIVSAIEEAGPGDTIVAWPGLEGDGIDQRIILSIHSLAALISPRTIVVAPLIEARCKSMMDVVALGKSHGMTEEAMRKCLDYPGNSTTISR